MIHSIAPLNKKLVFEPIPNSQHRLIGITLISGVSTASVPNHCRFNRKKANWKGFSEELEDLLYKFETIFVVVVIAHIYPTVTG